MRSHKKLIKITSWASVGVAIILVISKAFACKISNSLAVSASLIDSMSDLLSSVINFFAIRYALQPADNEHRFGHGKAEALAGLIQSIFIIIATGWLYFHAIHGVLHNHQLTENSITTTIMAASIVLTIGLVALQQYTIKKTNSLVITTDCLHYKADLLTNLGVLLTIYLHDYWNWLDPIIGLAIATYIMYSTINIIRQAFDVLMDRELSDKIQEEILKITMSHPQVLGVHDLRTRSSGNCEFIQMHLDLDGYMSLIDAHTIAETVEKSILNAFPTAEVIIHQDPLPYSK